MELSGAVARIEGTLTTTIAGMAERMESTRRAMMGMNTAMEQFMLRIIEVCR
jgi:hypothetical protein